jgi:hypothetical protein
MNDRLRLAVRAEGYLKHDRRAVASHLTLLES